MSAVATLASVEDHPRPLRQPAHARLPQSRQERAASLEVLTCGSVDDGKSTLIGRMLWDASGLHADQRSSSSGEPRPQPAPDFSLLVDGLAAGEQGITIDIAWRYSTRRRGGSSSSTAPATNNTRATWRPAPRMPTSPSRW
jgi:bifunctional enzyme CysN/CysC